MRKIVNPYPILFLGTAVVSLASILIRFSTAPPLIIAFYRLFYSVLILLPFNLLGYGEQLKRVERRAICLSVLAGLFLGFHFFFWITSLAHTTISSSVLLVTTHPVLVAVLAALLFQEKVTGPLFFGIFLTMVGSILVGVGGLQIDGRFLKGDFLAFLGAVMMAGYILVGSRVRKVLSLLPYVLLTYGAACIFLLLLALFFHPLRGYSSLDHGLFFLLALGPTVIGHTCFNWALKYISSTHVSVSILGEPLGATLLAILFFQEFPPFLALGGGMFILVGIYITVKN